MKTLYYIKEMEIYILNYLQNNIIKNTIKN